MGKKLIIITNKMGKINNKNNIWRKLNKNLKLILYIHKKKHNNKNKNKNKKEIIKHNTIIIITIIIKIINIKI